MEFEPILAVYALCLAVLSIFGLNRYILVSLFRRRQRHEAAEPLPEHLLPRVTVQLPIFNEMYVADRLIQAVCQIDYPRDLLEIQVLDDSTDETRDIAARTVERQAERGFDITYLHRTDRRGYKSGALEAGLREAKGEYIAIFDADFIPPADFLRNTLPHFADEKVGMVQARWGHINQDYSLLTKIQAILLDAHFVLEHGGRNRAGCFFNFNGTAGIWRRAAIDAAGGWQHDTLT
ncbi:MAG: glycosyltransferase, partial [bacterium]